MYAGIAAGQQGRQDEAEMYLRNAVRINSANVRQHCNTLQHTATHCNTLQHAAAHCSTLQHTAAHCSRSLCKEALQHVPAHCNTLQHIATHQRPATHCNTLPYTTTRYDML